MCAIYILCNSYNVQYTEVYKYLQVFMFFRVSPILQVHAHIEIPQISVHGVSLLLDILERWPIIMGMQEKVIGIIVTVIHVVSEILIFFE